MAYQRDEPRVEQQLRLLHGHGHEGHPVVGPVVCGQLGAAHQGRGLHQAVHVDREHLHGVGQDQLWGVGRGDRRVGRFLNRRQERFAFLQPSCCSDLTSSRRVGAVLPVARQHVGGLVDQDLPHALHGLIQHGAVG